MKINVWAIFGRGWKKWLYIGNSIFILQQNTSYFVLFPSVNDCVCCVTGGVCKPERLDLSSAMGLAGKLKERRPITANALRDTIISSSTVCKYLENAKIAAIHCITYVRQMSFKCIYKI